MGVYLRKREMIRVCALATLGLAALPGAQTQTTNATCLSGYAFLYNSLGQSPCLIAAYAAAVCNNGDYFVSSLDIDAHYSGPSIALVNDCQCSSILYSLMSACAVCQNRTITSWSYWDTNCKSVYLTVYPNRIPIGTAIPAWAYATISDDLFDPTSAKTLQSSPESVASINQATQTNAGGANPTHNGSPSSKSSNTAAIAGGVVAGTVVIAIIALLAFFLIRQRNNKRMNVMEPRTQYAALHLNTPGPEQSFTGGVNGGGGYVGQQQQNRGQQQQQHHVGEYTTPLLTIRPLPTVPSRSFYDPSDTSSVPGSPAPPSFFSHYTEPPQYDALTPAILPGAFRDAGVEKA